MVNFYEKNQGQKKDNKLSADEFFAAANTQKKQAKEDVTVLQQTLHAILIVNGNCNAHDSPSSIQYKIVCRTA